MQSYKYVLTVLVVIGILTAWLAFQSKNPKSRIFSIAHAFKALYYIKQEDVDRFMKSYELFSEDKVSSNNEKLIIDYYNVLNYLCALGEVEKMYIPPVMDPNFGVFDNQIEYEKKLMSYIGAKEGMHVLDVGCGRGGVASHVASHSGAKVTGINIDPSQISTAKQKAERLGLSEKLNFIQSSMNSPFPFEDNTFDGLYNIQALTYATSYDNLFREMYRVMKPGAKLSFLDWFVYENYDETNPVHKDMMDRCKPMIGAVYNPTPKDMVDALTRAGFVVEINENASIDGKQHTLIEKADIYFTTLQKMVNIFVGVGILPENFKVLFDRLTKDADSFINGDKMGLWTSCHQIVAVKPLI
jgi:sterol 24-C-methyltransferase